MTPATPAAAWVWPMLDFTEPSHSGRSARGPGRRWRAAPAPRSGRRACAGAVRLDGVDVGRRSDRASASACADHPLLRRAVRRGEPVGRAVLVDRASRATTASTRCPLRRASDSRSSSSSRRPRPSRCRRRRRRTPCTGRRATAPRWRLNSTNVPGVGHHRHAAGQRQIEHSPAPQCLRRQVQRDQRRRARRVHRDRRALQAERVGDAAGRDAGRAAGRRVALERPPARRAAGAVVVVRRRRRRRRCGCRAATAGSIPARSNASQEISSSSRCCGSIASASRGEMPKKPASNSAASCRKPPLAWWRRCRAARGRGRTALRCPSRGRRGTADGVAAVERPVATGLRGSPRRRGSGSPCRRSRSGRRNRRHGRPLRALGRGQGVRLRERCRRPVLGPAESGHQVRPGPPRSGSRRPGTTGSRRPVRDGEPVAQLDGGQRVEAEVAERPLGVESSAPAWPRAAAALERTSWSTRARRSRSDSAEQFGGQARRPGPRLPRQPPRWRPPAARPSTRLARAGGERRGIGRPSRRRRRPGSPRRRRSPEPAP